MDTNWLRERRGLVVAAIILVFTPVASLVFGIVGKLFSLIGFILSQVNPLGMLIAILIALGYLVYRVLRTNNADKSDVEDTYDFFS
jgi:uncharacterized membrane protein